VGEPHLGGRRILNISNFPNNIVNLRNPHDPGTRRAFSQIASPRKQVLLRISVINEKEKSIRLAVEGWLIGPWVEELRQQSERALSEATNVTLDLEKLWFADPSGAALLRQLALRDVAQLNCSSFISQQVKETNV